MSPWAEAEMGHARKRMTQKRAAAITFTVGEHSRPVCSITFLLDRAEHLFYNGLMAKKKPRRKKRKYNQDDILADFQRLPKHRRRHVIEWFRQWIRNRSGA